MVIVKCDCEFCTYNEYGICGTDEIELDVNGECLTQE